MPANPDPNWMTIAGLVCSTLGALYFGRVALAQGAALGGEVAHRRNLAQMRIDTMTSGKFPSEPWMSFSSTETPMRRMHGMRKAQFQKFTIK